MEKINADWLAGSDFRLSQQVHIAGSHSRFKGRLFDAGFHDALRKLAASPTLTGYAQLSTYFFKGACTSIHKFLDLAVCYSFAKTYVHGVYEFP